MRPGHVAAFATCLLFARTAVAQPELPEVELVEPAAPTAESYRPERPVKESHVVPVLESLSLLVSANLTARIAGAPWADVTPSTMWHNLTNEWVYDSDLFSVNQLAHPYGGALLYTAARSSGHGFWTSGAYAFGGSLLWETLAENEPPSINDQITTTVAGTFLGEALHRWGKAVLGGGGGNPGLPRRILAGMIDPAAALNRAVIGSAWRRVPPPEMHAYLAVGLNRPLGDATDAPLHGELAVSLGLPSDPRFVPHVPFDSFDLRGQLAASRDVITGYLDLRGILWGDAIGAPRRRALWGLYGTYSYWDADGARASGIGLGPGIAAHVAIGDRGFLEASAVAAIVPWGSAGGHGDVEGVRDYHRGPGGSEQVELKLGRRGLGVIRLSARSIQIVGKLRGAETETVLLTSASAMVALHANHSLGVELGYSARSSRFADTAMNATNQAAQVRLMYAVTSDSAYAGGGSTTTD